MTVLRACALAAALSAAACSPGGDAAGTETAGEAAPDYRGNDQTAGDGRPPAAQALADRFGLERADAILVPGAYRAMADTVRGPRITATLTGGEPPYLVVEGSADPAAILDNPLNGLAFEITPDRTPDFAGQTVIVTFIARTRQDFEDAERPGFRAAWIAGDANSGWNSMSLTNEWQKAVFAYDVPADAPEGAHRIAVLPPETGNMDIAAVAVRRGG